MSKKNMIIIIGVIMVFGVGVYVEKYLLLSQIFADNIYAMLRNTSMIKEKVAKEIDQLISTVKITSSILLAIFTIGNAKARLFSFKK